MLSAELIRAVRRIEIRTRHLVNDDLAGQYQAIFKGRGIEFDEVRLYQPGDEVRSIDWNVTARTGEPHVKRYVEERELTVMIAFDASASGLFGSQDRLKRELAAELAAVLAFSAISNNDKVGALAFTDQVELYIPPRKGRRQVLRLVRDLLAFEPCARGTDISGALDQLNRTLKRRAIIFLVSDLMVASGDRQALVALERSLTITNRRHDLVALRVNDPRELAWPKAGLMALEDAETGVTQWVDSADATWREAFERRAQAQRRQRDAMLARSRVDHIDVTAGSDYVEPLLAFFRARARRWRR